MAMTKDVFPEAGSYNWPKSVKILGMPMHMHWGEDAVVMEERLANIKWFCVTILIVLEPIPRKGRSTLWELITGRPSKETFEWNRQCDIIESDNKEKLDATKKDLRNSLMFLTGCPENAVTIVWENVYDKFIQPEKTRILVKGSAPVLLAEPEKVNES